MKLLFLVSVVIMGTAYMPSGNCQESVFIKHNCKIIDHGYFTFCSVTDNQTINEATFSYSIDFKKKSYAIMLLSEDTLPMNTSNKTYLNDFSGSDVWNQKRLGTSVEKYFLVFHKDFLSWSNSEKLDFFMQASKKEQK
jgi:hypothetical protein